MIPAVENLRRDWERIMTRLRHPDANFHPACDKCTLDVCCYEPVFSDVTEVKDILSRLNTEELARLRLDVEAWYEKAKLTFHMKQKGIAMPYRSMEIPCPFLKAGRCSIYACRPLACRTHYALENPENCRTANRPTQKYAIWDHAEAFQLLGIRYMVSVVTVEVDHFGLLLRNALNETTEKSAAHEVCSMTEKL